MKPDVLVDFIQQRVKSDLDDPAPGLVTCLKLPHYAFDETLRAPFARTHSSSIIFINRAVRLYVVSFCVCGL